MRGKTTHTIKENEKQKQTHTQTITEFSALPFLTKKHLTKNNSKKKKKHTNQQRGKEDHGT